MITLALDTSGPVGSVALLRDGQSTERALDTQQKHSALLLPTIDEVLKANGVTPRDVDLWAVGLGPGSYTGIRAGIAAAKGLALAWDRPLVGIGSVDTLIAEHGRDQRVAALLDARRGEFYFELANANEVFVPLRLVTPGGLAGLVDRPALFIGPEIKRFQNEVAQCLGPLALFPPTDVHPRASFMAYLAEKKFESQGRGDEKVEPIYLRQTTFVKMI